MLNNCPKHPLTYPFLQKLALQPYYQFLNFGGLTFVLSLVFHVLALCPKKAVEATLTCNCS